MAGLGIIRKFTGRAASEGVAFAIGTAVGPGLRPVVRELENDVWSRFRFWPLDAMAAAEAAAEGHLTSDEADAEAAKQGLSEKGAEALRFLAEVAPTLGLTLELWRRGDLTEPQVDHALAKARIEPQYRDRLKRLFVLRLSPQDVAVMVQRGVLPNEGLLPVGPPTEVGRVPPMPMANLDPIAEAAAGGYDRERLAAITRIIGLPPGPGELLQLLNRGTIVEADFYRGIAEGNTRNEWAESLLELRRRLLSPHEYAELHIRGWIDEPAMRAGASLSGLEPADTDLLAKMIGRPLNIHDVVRGIARGGAYNGPTVGIPEAYLRSLQEGNLRPEWYSIAYHNRYTYPSAFVLRSLTQSGELTTAETEQILLYEGWEPTLAAKVAGEWGGGTVAKADPWVKKAQGQLWTTIHKSYVNVDSDAAAAESALSAIGVDPASHAAVLALWDHERTITRSELSEKQLTKAVTAGLMTRDQAHAELLARGYDEADATTILAEET